MRFWDENVPARARTRLRSLHTSAADLCHILYVKLLPSPKVVSGCVKRRTDGVSLDEAASHTHTHSLSLPPFNKSHCCIATHSLIIVITFALAPNVLGSAA